MGPENNVRLGGCRIKECLLPYFNMVTVPHQTFGLERISDYRGVGLERFHCTYTLIVINAIVIIFLYSNKYNNKKSQINNSGSCKGSLLRSI